METIKIGIGTSSIGRFLPYVGKSAGLFDRANLAVEIINQLDEEKIVEDIVNHVTPIGTPNAPSLIFSFLNGNDLVIIGGVLNRPAFYLVANEKITSVGDLKGKKVGINQPRRMAGMMMLALLRRWGLDRVNDLELVDLGLNDRVSKRFVREISTPRSCRRRKHSSLKLKAYASLPTPSIFIATGCRWRPHGDFSRRILS